MLLINKILSKLIKIFLHNPSAKIWQQTIVRACTNTNKFSYVVVFNLYFIIADYFYLNGLSTVRLQDIWSITICTNRTVR